MARQFSDTLLITERPDGVTVTITVGLTAPDIAAPAAPAAQNGSQPLPPSASADTPDRRHRPATTAGAPPHEPDLAAQRGTAMPPPAPSPSAENSTSPPPPP
ncbi:hypothetical protein KRMM14A1259_45680 [Krasilnikovia sp. MM14-A1259]